MLVNIYIYLTYNVYHLHFIIQAPFIQHGTQVVEFIHCHAKYCAKFEDVDKFRETVFEKV